MSQRFDEVAPARDIAELQAFLLAEDHGNYLYRGQTKHYGLLIPSQFRKALTGKQLDHPSRHEISSQRFEASLDERSGFRFSLMSYLIEVLGKGLGNIVAQQYGLSSEAIDVTADPDIAAFFATRDYPRYEHFEGSPQHSLGVIYRFPKKDVTSSLANLETVLRAIGCFEPTVGERVWFDSYRKRWELSEED